MRLFSNRQNIIYLIAIIIFLACLDVFFYTEIQPDFGNNITSTFAHIFDGKPTCKDCNIILISVDTLGANHLPCYGYGRNTSPALCKFAQENILAKNMFSNSSFTLPSHVSIFTGLYPMKHRVNIPNVDSLDKNIPLLPEILKKDGYETYFCMTDTDPHLPINAVYNRGIDKIYKTSELINWSACIKKLIANNKKNKKTFIFLHTYNVHAPYIPKKHIQDSRFLTHQKIPTIPENMDAYLAMKYNEDFFSFLRDRLQKDISDGYWGNKTKKYESYLTTIKAARSKKDKLAFLNNGRNIDLINEYLGTYYIYKTNSIEKQQVGRLIDLYDTTIFELDNYLGSLFTRIKDGGLWNNTVIAITSDHGEEFMEHQNVVGHGANLYDTVTKVPLIMRIPGINKRAINKITESVDIFPTLIEVVGIKNNLKFQGADIFNTRQKEYVMSDLIYPDWVIRSSRNTDWKLYVKQEKKSIVPYALYHIRKDTDENRNLIYRSIPEADRLLTPFLR